MDITNLTRKRKCIKNGEWNKICIRVLEDSVTTLLNGVKMTEINDAKIGQGKGRIMLQLHREDIMKIKWKNILIKELNK